MPLSTKLRCQFFICTAINYFILNIIIHRNSWYEISVDVSTDIVMLLLEACSETHELREKTVEIATYLVVCIFNKRFIMILKYMNLLGINIGLQRNNFAIKVDKQRMQALSYNWLHMLKKKPFKAEWLKRFWTWKKKDYFMIWVKLNECK